MAASPSNSILPFVAVVQRRTHYATMAPSVSLKAAAVPMRPLAGLRRAASKAQKVPVASTSKEMMVWTPNDNKCAPGPLPAASRGRARHRALRAQRTSHSTPAWRLCAFHCVDRARTGHGARSGQTLRSTRAARARDARAALFARRCPSPTVSVADLAYERFPGAHGCCEAAGAMCRTPRGLTSPRGARVRGARCLSAALPRAL